MIEAQGYEELAYLVLRECGEWPIYLTTSQICELSQKYNIKISIATQWEPYSKEFERYLASFGR